MMPAHGNEWQKKCTIRYKIANTVCRIKYSFTNVSDECVLIPWQTVNSSNWSVLREKTNAANNVHG